MDALRRFHQNPFFFFGLFCLIGALILQWRVPTLRRWLLMAAVVELLVIPGTVLYVYPINDVLFVHAGGGLDSATADAFTRHWAASRPHTVRIEDSGFPVLAAHIESYRTSWTRPTDRCLNTKV